jgi:hypothetical protein
MGPVTGQVVGLCCKRVGRLVLLMEAQHVEELTPWLPRAFMWPGLS